MPVIDSDIAATSSLRDRILESARRWLATPEDAITRLMPPAKGFDRALDDAVDDLSVVLGEARSAFLADVHAHACFSERVYRVPGANAPLNVRTGLVFLPITGFAKSLREDLQDEARAHALTHAFQEALPGYGLGPAKVALMPGSVSLVQMIATGPERLHAAILAAEAGRDPAKPNSLTRLPDPDAHAAIMRPFGDTAHGSGDDANLQSRCLVFVVLQTGIPEGDDGQVIDERWIKTAQTLLPSLLVGIPSDPHEAIQEMVIHLVRCSLKFDAALQGIPSSFPASRYHVHRHANGLDVALEYGSTLIGPVHLPTICAEIAGNILVEILAEDGIPVVEHAGSFHTVQSRRGRLS